MEEASSKVIAKRLNFTEKLQNEATLMPNVIWDGCTMTAKV